MLDYNMLGRVYTVRLADKVNYPVLPSTTNSDVSARLVLFQQCPGSTVCKVGMKRALLPDDCENPLLECFPSQLALQPIENIKFGANKFPAPREIENELQSKNIIFPMILVTTKENSFFKNVFSQLKSCSKMQNH